MLAKWYTLPERDKGWLAGIVDGEGTILWRKRQQPSGKIRPPSIDVPNTDMRILNRLQSIWSLPKLYTRPTPPGHKQLWYWRINGAKAVALIWLLRPYLATEKAWKG